MANFNLGNLVWKITAESAQFNQSLKSSEDRLSKFSLGLKTAGLNLTKFVTAPLAGAALASVKFASDLQESTNAVNVVFGESADIITAWGENAAEQAGLSQASFNTLATQVGVLLQQTGKDFDDVADDTITLTQRAADLASIYNTDVTDAVNALGAALRGESEPARRYGVLLSEAAVQAKALELGLGGVSGELTEAEKVQARYAIILDSTNQVAGDFARTNGDTANSLRVIRAEAENVAADLGQVLLPVVADILADVREWVDRLGELDEEQLKTIITIGGVVAAIGPLAVGVGNLISILPQLKLAFVALTGPVGAAVAGFTALAVALGTVAARNLEIKNQNAAEAYRGIAAAAGLAGSEIRNINNFFEDFFAFNPSLQNATNLVETLAQEYGKTEEEITEILLASGQLSAQALEQVRLVQQRQILLANEEQQTLSLEAAAEQYEQRQRAITSQVNETTDALEDQGQVVEEQQEIFVENIAEQKALKEFLRDQQLAIWEKETEAYALATQARQDLEFVSQEEIDRISADNAEREKARQKELLDAQKEKWETALGFASQYASAVQGFSDAVTQREIDNIEKSGASEAEKTEKIAALKRRQAIFDKAVTITQIGIETARAVVASLPNLVLAGLSAGLGAVQLATAIAQPIPTFATGGSFIVPPGFGNDSFPLTTAMVQSGERVTVEPAGSFGQSSKPMLIQLMIDGRQMAQTTAEYINGGQVRIELR